eukprot:IDg3029t1
MPDMLQHQHFLGQGLQAQRIPHAYFQQSRRASPLNGPHSKSRINISWVIFPAYVCLQLLKRVQRSPKATHGYGATSSTHHSCFSAAPS